MSHPAHGGAAPVPLRLQCAVYATGTFSNSSSSLVGVLLPLWLVSLDASPFAIGLAIGSRHILPLLLSIHGGAMMDRLGTRRVMVVFAWIGVITPLLFPLFPWLWAVMALQTLGGISSSMGWIGSQTLIGQVMGGNPIYAGRLSFVLRIGQLIGPTLTGAMWDLFGPVAAFGVLAAWGAGLLISSMLLPSPPPRGKTEQRSLRAADLVPRLSDYVTALGMLMVPGIAIVMVVTFIRIAAEGIQSSFYTVYLNGTGLSGTAIGILIAISSIVGSGATLTVGWASRFIRPIWLLVHSVVGSIVFMAVTPLIPSYGFLLAIGVLRGAAMGISQPLMISILFNCVPPGAHGISVGLRTTINRLAAALTPIVMGAVAQMTGVEESFYLIGGALLAAMAAVMIAVRRLPDAFEEKP